MKRRPGRTRCVGSGVAGIVARGCSFGACGAFRGRQTRFVDRRVDRCSRNWTDGPCDRHNGLDDRLRAIDWLRRHSTGVAPVGSVRLVRLP